MSTPMPHSFSVKDAAMYVGLSYEAMRARIRRGQIAYVRLDDHPESDTLGRRKAGTILLLRRDLEDWLAAHRVEGGAK